MGVELIKKIIIFFFKKKKKKKRKEKKRKKEKKAFLSTPTFGSQIRKVIKLEVNQMGGHNFLKEVYTLAQAYMHNIHMRACKEDNTYH